MSDQNFRKPFKAPLSVLQDKEGEIKSRFATMVSHEFRLPLTSIQFQIKCIKQAQGQISEHELSRRLDSVEKQVTRMTALLDDVLSYGKCGTNIPLMLSEIKLIDFLNKTIEELSHCDKMRAHIVKTEYALMPVVIVSDERLLRGILTNLLSNAIKFSPGKECVYLTGDGCDDAITIRVRDHGIGIPPDEIKKIFEPFIRGKSAGSIQGTGLGLTIVKKSVELLKGSIRVESEIGKGSTFEIKLPIRVEQMT